MLTAVKESFHIQLKMVFDKLTGAQNQLLKSHRETNQSKSLNPQVMPDNASTDGTATTTKKGTSIQVREHTRKERPSSGLQRLTSLVKKKYG